MIWYRIDNRLIHGQIIETWLPYLKAGVLAIADNALASDDLRQQIMLMAVPQRVRTEFLTLAALPAFIQSATEFKLDALVLFSNCQDVRAAFDAGIPIDICNVGNMHYCDGKRQICPHVAISGEDEACLKFLQSNGIELDFRCVPADTPEVKDW